MPDHRQSEELRDDQLKREATEEERARSAADEQETAQHERRAQKARYLREKLEERVDSEREADEH
jgi:hypothetical protein